MTPKNQAALDFLLTRRSRPAKLLSAPVPDRAEIETLLRAAARTPDHGKLEPWRFIVLQGDALSRLAALVESIGTAQNIAPEQIEKARRAYADADLVVAVIAAPKDSPKVPQIEQIYSAGAVCLSLLNAALASGWGANWLSGWASHTDEFRTQGLGLDAHEQIAGLIHIGTASAVPPERPRPDLAAITQWMDA